MSGYFEALMRSSGMAVGAEAPVAAFPKTGAVEHGVERDPIGTPSPAEPKPPPASKPAVLPVDLPVAAEPLAKPAPVAAATEADEAQAGFSDRQDAHPHLAADMARDPEEARPVEAFEASKPILGEEIVRAAIRWVAADPAQIHGVAQRIPPSGQPVALHEQIGAVAEPPAPSAGRVSLPPQRPNMPPPTPGTPEFVRDAPAIAQALPIRPARPAEATPPAPLAPLTRGEIVEVSIGAIHLRVDAPGGQMVAAPAATPPTDAPRTATAKPPRSALSRRALRRI